MIIKSNETCKDAILTANSNSINYPTTNILDSRLSRIFRTSSSTTAEIVFDCVTAVSVDTIGIANHNITSSVTTLKVQGNATDSWGSPSVDETLTYNSGIITNDFTGGSYRYWRIQIIDATNPDGFIEIGRAWIGEKYQLSEILPSIEHQAVDPSIVTRTAANQTYGDIRTGYDIIDVSFPVVPYAEKTELFDIFRDIGSYTPTFFIFGEVGIDKPSIYGTINQGSLSASMLNDGLNYSIGFSIIEEL